MSVSTMIVLNRDHKEIISDRPIECIREVHFDCDEPSEIEQTMTRDEALDYIESQIESILGMSSLDFSELNPLQREIIEDVISGSTSACSMIESSAKGKIKCYKGLTVRYRNLCKAGDELADAFNAATGSNVCFPHR